ncbi:hypothetical protein TRVA0_016S00430 [Trichomonascus vanleenenianus]|uniref:uncharacterized protein n=1 Tax=Trichomonascus vanleenenianus TaxID=2268995 RepID=UPI003ECA285B
MSEILDCPLYLEDSSMMASSQPSLPSQGYLVAYDDYSLPLDYPVEYYGDIVPSSCSAGSEYTTAAAGSSSSLVSATPLSSFASPSTCTSPSTPPVPSSTPQLYSVPPSCEPPQFASSSTPPPPLAVVYGQSPPLPPPPHHHQQQQHPLLTSIPPPYAHDYFSISASMLPTVPSSAPADITTFSAKLAPPIDLVSERKSANATPKSRRKTSRKNGSSAPPGPIPATTPTLVRRDEQGVEWIAFEYSKERVKTSYCIRCDIETVDQAQLPAEFKADNCIYPRACVPPDQYTGNRQKYETECNTIGWCLAYLNPKLRNQRGLIQRAVDSWRNTNADPSYRSRRVRRMSKKSSVSSLTVPKRSKSVADLSCPPPVPYYHAAKRTPSYPTPIPPVPSIPVEFESYTTTFNNPFAPGQTCTYNSPHSPMSPKGSSSRKSSLAVPRRRSSHQLAATNYHPYR